MKNFYIERSNYFFLALFFFASCGISTAQSPKMEAAGSVSHRFIKEVSENYPYAAFGTGGAFCCAVNGLIIEFRTFEETTEAQAEQNVRDLYDRLIAIINADPKIRPYLVEWPFPGKDTCIGIMFFDPITKDLRNLPHLAEISIKDGDILKLVQVPETDQLMNSERYEKTYGRKFNEEPAPLRK